MKLVELVEGDGYLGGVKPHDGGKDLDLKYFTDYPADLAFITRRSTAKWMLHIIFEVRYPV